MGKFYKKEFNALRQGLIRINIYVNHGIKLLTDRVPHKRQYYVPSAALTCLLVQSFLERFLLQYNVSVLLYFICNSHSKYF